MATTTKGVPYPVASDPNNVPADMQRLATWLDTNPGIASYTTAQRDALVAADRWTGRTIWNTTNFRHEIWDGAAWVQDGVSVRGGDTITASGAGVRPLAIRLAAGQTASSFEVLASDGGTVLDRISAAGAVHIRPDKGLQIAAMLSVAPSVVGDHGIAVRTVTGMTGDPMRVERPDGSALFSVSAAGGVAAAGNVSGVTVVGSSDVIAGGVVYAGGSAGESAWQGGQMQSVPQDTSRHALVLKQRTAGTGDLLRILNSAGSPLITANSAGDLNFSRTNPDAALTFLQGLRIVTAVGGTSKTFSFTPAGGLDIPGKVRLSTDATTQGTDANGVALGGLEVGNDVAIYDVNIANSLGFQGVANRETFTMVFGRSSVPGPGITGNDVNKNLVLVGNRGNPASRMEVRGGQSNVQGLVSIAHGGSEAIALEFGSGSNFDGATMDPNTVTSGLRFYGYGVAHGDVTFHPSARAADHAGHYRFHTTGSSQPLGAPFGIVSAGGFQMYDSGAPATMAANRGRLFVANNGVLYFVSPRGQHYVAGG